MKLLKINSCYQCTHRETIQCLCLLTGDKTPIQGIPKSCPLPNSEGLDHLSNEDRDAIDALLKMRRGLHPRKDIFGFFDDNSDTPTHDPGFNAICPVCAKVLSRPVKTISLIPDKIRTRSYFFRVHKSCWDGIDEVEK